MNKKDWRRDWLTDGATWRESLSGDSRKTPVARAMLAEVMGDFGSVIPRGIEPPTRWMRELDNAMQRVHEEGGRDSECVAIVRAWYLLGAEFVQEELGTPSRTLYKRKGIGEQRLRQELRGH